MGLFDRFRSSAPAAGASPAPRDKNVPRLAKVAGDKYAQNYDRAEAIDALAKVGSAESAEALLRRFSFHTDPSITDQEEKEAAERGVLASGEAAVRPILAACARAESLTWPLRILKQLVSAEQYRSSVLSLLEKLDADYVRNAEPKRQLVAELVGLPGDEVREAATRFLEDADDKVRFAAVDVLRTLGDPRAAAAVASQLTQEESVMLRNHMADALAISGAPLDAPLRDALRPALPSAFALDTETGVVRRVRS